MFIDLSGVHEDNFIRLLDEVEAVSGEQDCPLPLEQDLQDAEVENVVCNVGIERAER